MIVRSEDFELRPPKWTEDPSTDPELRAQFEAQGLAEPMNRVECVEIVDDCAVCGKKLTTPYIYWNASQGGISLHPKCAADLALGLTQDACELSQGKPAETERHAVEWLGLYAQKKLDGVE